MAVLVMDTIPLLGPLPLLIIHHRGRSSPPDDRCPVTVFVYTTNYSWKKS